MPWSYADAVAEVQRRGRFGVRLGLARTKALLAALGHPEREMGGALIAGTNGKGSVLSLAAAAATASGLRVGHTPKPHLVTYRERLQIDGALIQPETFAQLVRDLLPAADGVARRHGDPTEFELMTALAFRWFADERVDLALVEVGLGGRLDATHAWDGGVAVVTNVALDHTQWLGPTETAIAREKAAIIMRGDRAVTGAIGPALDVIRRRARRVGAPLTEVTPPPVRRVDRDGIVVELPTLGPVLVGLRGRHQAVNAAVADATLDALEEAGLARVPADARRSGYARARWPGRLEFIEPPEGLLEGGTADEVILDGAHNPAGALALARALDELRPHLAARAGDVGEVSLLMAVMGDKDLPGMIHALDTSELLAGARVVCTQVPGERSFPAEALAESWRSARPDGRVEAVHDPAEALSAALARPTRSVVVAGSLYLVGLVRSLLVDDASLRDPVEEP